VKGRALAAAALAALGPGIVLAALGPRYGG